MRVEEAGDAWDASPVVAPVLIVPHDERCPNRENYPDRCYQEWWSIWRDFFCLPAPTRVYVPFCQIRVPAFGGRVSGMVAALEDHLHRRIINREQAYDLLRLRDKAHPLRTRQANARAFDDELRRTAIYHSSYTAYWFQRDVVQIITTLYPKPTWRCLWCGRWRRPHQTPVVWNDGHAWCSSPCATEWTYDRDRRAVYLEKERRCLRNGQETMREIRRWLKKPNSHAVSRSRTEE